MYKVMKSFICRGCLNPVTGTGRTSVGANVELWINVVQAVGTIAYQ